MNLLLGMFLAAALARCYGSAGRDTASHDLKMNFNKIAPFGQENTLKELNDYTKTAPRMTHDLSECRIRDGRLRVIAPPPTPLRGEKRLYRKVLRGGIDRQLLNDNLEEAYDEEYGVGREPALRLRN